MLEKRTLPNTDLELSLLGLGTVKFGRNTQVKYPDSFELPSLEQIINLLELAQSNNINTLDTAPAYGDSEIKLGQIFKNKNNNIARDNWVIITKAGEEFKNKQSIYDFSANFINNSINNSLKNLNTDHLDILLIHSDGNDQAIADNDELWSLLETRKQMGDIKAYGVSSKTATGGIACLKRADLAMVTYRQDYLSELPLLDYAAQNNKGVILKKVLNSGHLSAEENLQFSAAHQAVTSMVVGTINPEHLLSNIRCLS